MDSVSHGSLPAVVFKIKHLGNGMILEKSLLRDGAEVSAGYLKDHWLQNGRKITEEFTTSLPNKVL